jgi:hypothetical protein
MSHHIKDQIMKYTFPLLMAALLVMALGCNEGTPGGPGVKKNASSASTSSSNATTQETPGSSTTETTKVEVQKPALASETPQENTAPAGTDANPIAGDPENSFRLDAPNLATTVKQGETKVVTIGIARSKNFDQDVTLMFEDVPTGVTIDPAEAMIKHGEKEVKLNISAAADAAVNDFTIKIIGHPATGPDATNKFNLTVSKP